MLLRLLLSNESSIWLKDWNNPLAQSTYWIFEKEIGLQHLYTFLKPNHASNSFKGGSKCQSLVIAHFKCFLRRNEPHSNSKDHRTLRHVSPSERIPRVISHVGGRRTDALTHIPWPLLLPRIWWGSTRRVYLPPINRGDVSLHLAAAARGGSRTRQSVRTRFSWPRCDRVLRGCVSVVEPVLVFCFYYYYFFFVCCGLIFLLIEYWQDASGRISLV